MWWWCHRERLQQCALKVGKLARNDDEAADNCRHAHGLAQTWGVSLCLVCGRAAHRQSICLASLPFQLRAPLSPAVHWCAIRRCPAIDHGAMVVDGREVVVHIFAILDSCFACVSSTAVARPPGFGPLPQRFLLGSLVRRNDGYTCVEGIVGTGHILLAVRFSFWDWGTHALRHVSVTDATNARDRFSRAHEVKFNRISRYGYVVCLPVEGCMHNI